MDFQLTLILVFFAAFFGMKTLAWMVSPNAKPSFLYNSPLFAPFTLRRSLKKSPTSVKRLKERFFFLALANILGIEFYQFLFQRFDFPTAIKGLIFAPYLYLFTNLVGVSAQAFGLLTKEIPTDLHNHPYLSSNINEFWGKRWNVWVGDWLALMSKKSGVKSKELKVFLAFLFSGIFHEIIIALPYYIRFGESYFGRMTLFFLLQFIFVSIDKLALSRGPKYLRRTFLWLSLAASVPLFANPSVLAFFGF